MYMFFFFFFKQKTAYEMRISDWSSDVCSSDLIGVDEIQPDGILRDQQFAFTRQAGVEPFPRDHLRPAMAAGHHPPCLRHAVVPVQRWAAKKSAVRLSASCAAASLRRAPISAAKPWSSPS